MKYLYNEPSREKMELETLGMSEDFCNGYAYGLGFYDGYYFQVNKNIYNKNTELNQWLNYEVGYNKGQKSASDAHNLYIKTLLSGLL